MYVCMYVCMYLCMYVCIYVCMLVCCILFSGIDTVLDNQLRPVTSHFVLHLPIKGFSVVGDGRDFTLK